jgi:hypothetical protein
MSASYLKASVVKRSIRESPADRLTGREGLPRRRGAIEGARQAGERFGIAHLASGCVAGGQHAPIGVEIELRDLGGGQQPIVLLQAGGRDAILGRCEDQPRLGLGLQDRRTLAALSEIAGIPLPSGMGKDRRSPGGPLT